MKFRQKMLLAMVWLLSVSYGIGGVLLIEQSFRSSLDQARSSAIDAYEMTLQSVQLVNLVDIQQDVSSIRAALARMDRQANQVGVQLSQNQALLYRSGETVRRLSPRQDCLRLLYAEQNGHYLQISGLVHTNGAPLQLDIVYDITPVYTARQAQIQTYHRSFALLLLLGGFTAWGVSWLLTRPIGRLSGTARRLAAGKLDARVRARSHDEIGLLSADFDRMADQLSQNITAMQESMEQQERFMGSFAHELKTPMTSIIGYADLLRSQSLDAADAQEAANYIFSEGKRLEALSLKLLELLVTKNQTLRLTPTEMAPLLEALVRHLQPVYQAGGITLQCRCAPGRCRIEPDLFRSVLTNLLDNARKALDGGGTIFVLSERRADSYRILIVDNGRGMPEEALRHLTEAFYRVDKSRSRKQGGAGLGLTLCKQILELHGGSISFASREGNGTVVTVCLKMTDC